MSSDFAVFQSTDGQAVAVRRSSVTAIKNCPSCEEHTIGHIAICCQGGDYIKVDHPFSYVISELDQATIAPPAQLIPCGPIPLGITIEQLGSVIAELTPMLEAIVQAKQV